MFLPTARQNLVSLIDRAALKDYLALGMSKAFTPGPLRSSETQAGWALYLSTHKAPSVVLVSRDRRDGTSFVSLWQD